MIDFKHVCCRSEALSERSNRVLDLVLLGLLALPVVILIVVLSIVILTVQGRPIFYKSPRLGISGRVFMLAKFRSMTSFAPLQETSPEMQCYVTPLGSFLRRTSLDELPQIIHVITGTMSFVGPRPCLQNQEFLVHHRRTRGLEGIRPGITGLAQVKGRDLLSDRNKLRYEKFYFQKRSVGLYALIITMTIKRVITMRGVSH